MNQAKPGFWPSDLDEKTVCQAGRDYGQLQMGSDGTPYWVEYRPESEGRNLLIRYLDGECRVVTPAGFSVRSRVHEYGGDAWCLCESGYVFVNALDQQIYKHAFDHEAQPEQLTSVQHSRFLQPVWDKAQKRLIAIEEIHNEDHSVINRLVAISLYDGAIIPLHEGYDFYTYPTLCSALNVISFIAWNHPDQPWTATKLVELEFDSCGVVIQSSILAGEAAQESLSQPFYSEEGGLYVISDRDGWWNLYRVERSEARLSPVLQQANDMMPSPWLAGPRHYSIYEGGLIHLKFQHAAVDLCVNGGQLKIDELNHIRAFARSGGQLIFIAAGSDRLPGVIRLDLKTLRRDDAVRFEVLAGLERPLDIDSVALPRALKVGEAFGYLYPGRNASQDPLDTLPLVIFLHGGPTAATYPILNLKIQYWTQRGFAVLDLNYQGSSNYGRDYRMRLQHRWGEIEVTDIRQAVEALILEGVVDPEAVFVRGNSSGGYSALNALCELDIFAAGASLYGVSDPLALNAATHKFESHYLEWLIGDPEQELARFRQFSPCYKADKISAPVIFFQGEQDAVVVPDQTRSMVAQLQSAGVEVEACYFPEEGHGFRNMSNQIEVLQRELAFYQQRL